MDFLHQKLNFPLNPSNTPCTNALGYVSVAFMAPLVVATGIAISPLIGLIYGVDGICYLYKKKQHKSKMKTDWYYRFCHVAVRVNDLPKWQERISDTNQFERAILQITEANDVPYEIWQTLKHLPYFCEHIQTIGTDAYQLHKEAIVQKAIQYYIQEYATFMNCSFEEAKSKLS